MNYTGMTVNERLVISGLDKKFDKAVSKKEKEVVIQILKKVKVNQSSIIDILNKYNIS